jgi:threonine dehydrogenase-like Zn-dependent dehydrogenase
MMNIELLIRLLFIRVKLVQWNGDAYDQILVERTRDACKGEVDIVIGCIGLGAPLQRSFKCLKKGGIAFVTEDVNEKVWKPLKKMADSQCKELKMVERTNPGDLKSLLDLVAAEQVCCCYFHMFHYQHTLCFWILGTTCFPV